MAGPCRDGKVPNAPSPSRSDLRLLEAGGPRTGTLRLSSCSLFARYWAADCSNSDVAGSELQAENRKEQADRINPRTDLKEDSGFP